MSTALLEKPGGASAGNETERQIVALHLSDEVYGVDIACIHTVLTPQPITQVPNVPAYVRGVMNLRGRILPVLDLRTRFGLPLLEAEKQKASRIVIVEAAGLTAGLVVDSVSEVLRLPESAIEPPSALLASADLRCLTGIGRVPGGRRKDDNKADPDRLILLLDIPQTLTLADAETLGHFHADN